MNLARWCAFGFTALFLLVSVTPLVSFVIRATEPEWYDGPGDVLIVLGGSMLVAGIGPTATLGDDSYVRCVYASFVLSQRAFPIVIVTGDNGAAEAMAHFISQQVTPIPRILIENRAASTYDNALYTKQLLTHENLAAHRLVLLTSDYHAWRARRVFRRLGMDVRVIPAPELLKHSNRVLERWPAFIGLANELFKDMLYGATNRL